MSEEIINNGLKKSIYENAGFLDKNENIFKRWCHNMADVLNYSEALYQVAERLNEKINDQMNKQK